MIEFNSLKEIEINENTGVALGTFDGFHTGHMTVLEKLIERCKVKGVKSLLFTFSNHPRGIDENKRILSVEDKISKIRDMGFDYLVMIPFDYEVKNIDPKLFVENILIERLRAVIVAVGYNYRFGKFAGGDVNFLFNYSHVFELNIISKVTYDNSETISSTYVRQLIETGEMETVRELLGQPYRLTGKVTGGKQVGRKFGFPTANLGISNDMTDIGFGVYATRTMIDEKYHASVTNVGINPTSGAGGTFKGRLNIETYILDFNETIYGKTIVIEFIKRLRDEIKFTSKEDLFKQIANDVDVARRIIKSYNK